MISQYCCCCRSSCLSLRSSSASRWVTVLRRSRTTFILTDCVIMIFNLVIYFMQEQSQMQVLVLGGTNFMGKCLVEMLPSSWQVHLINRGKNYWANEVYKNHPNVHYFYGDRSEHKQMHKAVEYLNKKIGIDESRPWNLVVDFTSYKWRDIQSIAKALKNKTELYIFISTDSIYNNRTYDKQQLEKGISEKDFHLQEEYRKNKHKKVSDKYGYDKLKCELYLQRQKHLPFINLRLPDVLGPYDNTNRYWCSLEWIKNSEKYPMELCPNDKNKKLSFVYSKDIAKTILYLADNRESVQKYKSYNLGFKQNPTYKQFIELMASKLRKPVTPNFVEVKKNYSNGMYPSTKYTNINCGLAVQKINWNPSLLIDCITESNQFFEVKALSYPSQLKEMNKQYKKKVIGKE